MVGTAIDIGTMITSSPEIRGGRPRVAGTSMTVMRIAGWHKLGFIPEEIARKIGLSLAQIHAALAYYHANKEIIDADLADEDEAYERYANANQQQPQNATTADLEVLFQSLVQQWRSETAHLSLILKKVTHPAYQRIIGLGPRVVPLILRELEQKPGFWFWALQAITGEDPAPSEATVDETTQAWLQWGKQRQYL
jgi:uncharacterized protein (DUF433 family)